MEGRQVAAEAQDGLGGGWICGNVEVATNGVSGSAARGRLGASEIIRTGALESLCQGVGHQPPLPGIRGNVLFWRAANRTGRNAAGVTQPRQRLVSNC